MNKLEKNKMEQLHPNIQLIQRFFYSYANNDLACIKEILASDIKWVIPGNHILSGTKRGVEEVLNYFKELSKYHFEAEPIVMGFNEDYVIDCHWNWSNTNGSDNLKSMSCLLWKISGGKIIEVYNFPQDQYLVDSFFGMKK